MAQDKRTFLGGMNKDVDIRLIKNPDYIDALNIRVASSTDGTIGSVENIEGNKEVPFEFYSEGQDSLFINDNGLYQQVNPATVFYQKVVRIQGWESVNQNYSFTLYSITDNGDNSGYGTIPIGEFSWVGNEARTATTQYLYSQFSGVGGLNTGINVYDVNTNAQYTASVKLLSFGQNSLLSGGYLDIVIECDVAGVDFHLGASSNLFEPKPYNASDIYEGPVDDFTYTFDEDSDVKITSSGNVYISLLSSFETGGLYNADANDDGILISPEGQIYEMGNRTVWKINFEVDQPTSPTNFDEVTIFSYRENLGIIDGSTNYEHIPFLTIKKEDFAGGAQFEFDSTKTSLSKYLINEFSEDKVVLCDGLPLDFSLGSDNFFLTFSTQDQFSFDSGIRSVIIYGPVGVRFKLALADSSEFLHQVLNPNQDVEDSIDIAPIFNNNSFIRLQNLQIVENSINITDSITNHINDLQISIDGLNQDLVSHMANYTELQASTSNLEQQLENALSLSAQAAAQVAALSANIVTLEANESSLQTQIDNARVTIENLEAIIDNLVISDSISIQLFEDTHSTFTSINTLYDNTKSLYETLSVTNQVVYEEDFGAISSFTNKWKLYDNVFSNSSPNSVFFIDRDGNPVLGINPTESEQIGYLKMPFDSNGYSSAVRLPYYNFDNPSAWQVGSEMTIRIEFDIVNTSTGPGAITLPSNYKVLVTNEWDINNNFLIPEPYAFAETYNLTIGAVKNPEPFVHTFEIVDDENSYSDNKLKNITIIADPLIIDNAEDIEVRITNARISNDSQEMFAFQNIEPVNVSRQSYLNLHSQIENVITGFEASNSESIEDFLNNTDDYQEFLGNLIPGYIDGDSSLPALLDVFTSDVSAFTSNVQNQFASRLEIFTNALNVNVQDEETAIQFFQGQIFDAALEINSLQSEINSLNNQLSTGLNSMTGLFDGANIVTSVYNIVGPEPAIGQPIFNGSTGEISPSGWGSYIGNPDGICFVSHWKINGNDAFGSRIVLVSTEEVNNLKNNPWSETNNICHYITSRFQNNQTIDIEIPEEGYLTQTCRIVFVNFDEDTNILNEDLNATIEIGQGAALFDQEIDVVAGNSNIYNQGGVGFNNMPILQMLFYFDQTEGDNVTFSEDLYLVGFDDPSGGNDSFFFSPFLGSNSSTDFLIVKPDCITINTWNP